MSLKDDYYAKMISQFRRWDAEFGMLSDKSGQTGDAEDAGRRQQLRAMRAERDATHKRLQEIRTASESGWRPMQSAVDASWIALRTSLDTAISRARK